MLHTTSRTKRLRQLLVWLGLAVCVVVLGLQLARLRNPAALPVDDFVEYWAAGRLNLSGGNPYAPDQLLALQRAAGWPKSEPLMMWNPPWTLALVMPFAWFSYPVGRFLWLGLNFAVLLWCVDWIWRFYGGHEKQRWISWIVGLTFLPALLVLRFGQITLLLLLSIVGFLHWERREQLYLAGVSASLVAVKPHLVYLFWVAVILWAIDRRRWPVVFGSGFTTLLATAVVVKVNPSVVGQYVDATASQPPFYWLTPTFGAMLRMLLGWKLTWLQLLPPVLGIVWFLFYWWKRRLTWQWAQEMPLLLLVSVATTAYGWSFDSVMLLLPVLQIAVLLSISHQHKEALLAMVLYLLIDVWVLYLRALQVNEFWYIWLAPVLLGCYLALRGLVRKGECFGAPV